MESNLQHLHARVHNGQYWPNPVRRTHIPKSDGRRRPLGVPALEDKIVQGAVAEVLNAVYEADFLGFSHGFGVQPSLHLGCPGKGDDDAARELGARSRHPNLLRFR